MKTPIKSYRIWHAPRVGSTLLCQLLEDTGLAGRPGEHLTLHGEKSLCERYGVNSYEEIRNAVWELGTDSNGIFAAKVGAHNIDHNPVVTELCKLKGIAVPSSYETLWADFFPNCKHVIILRRDKIKQITSWWKAIQDDRWHLRGEETYKTTDEFYTDKYNVDALTHLYHEAIIRDIANGEYLKMNNLPSKTVVYEDLISHPGRVINEVLSYLELSDSEVQLPAMKYKKTSNNINDDWSKRYLTHLQSDWKDKVWNP